MAVKTQEGKYLKVRAYDIIKHKIVHCELEPGSPVSEKELIEEIGVSRTPIREAFHKLEEENLVKIYPKRGIFVTDISPKDVLDIYTLRVVIEPFAASIATPYISLKELERYYTIWNDPEYDYAPDDHIALDREFHGLIAKSTGNKYLTQMLFRLYDQVNRIRVLSLRKIKERRQETQHEHLAIITAFRAREARDAEQAMRMHLTHAQDSALKIFL